MEFHITTTYIPDWNSETEKYKTGHRKPYNKN